MPVITKFAQSNSGAWTNPTNAYSDNGIYATAAPARSGSTVSNFFNFNFNLPSNAIINSITVEVEWKVSVTTSIDTLSIQTYLGTTAKGTALSTTTLTTADLKQNTLSNGTFTVAELNDNTANGFNVRLTAARGNTATGYTASVDYISVTIDYTESDRILLSKNIFDPNLALSVMQTADPTATIVTVDGRRCLRVFTDTLHTIDLQNNQLAYKANTAYTFSTYVKYDMTQGTGSFNAMWQEMKATDSTMYEDGAWDEAQLEFHRLVTTSEATKTVSTVYFSYSNGAYWFIDLDGMQMEEGPLTDYVPYMMGVQGEATINNSSSLSATGNPVQTIQTITGEANISNDSSLAVDGIRVVKGAAAISDNSSLEANGKRKLNSALNIVNTSILAASGNNIVKGAANISAQDQITVDGRGVLKDSAQIMNDFELSAAAKIYRTDSVDLQNNSQFRITGNVIKESSANIQNDSALSADGITIKYGAANVQSYSELIVGSRNIVIGAAEIDINSSCNVSGNVIKYSRLNIIISNTNVINSKVIAKGSALIQNDSQLEADGHNIVYDDSSIEIESNFNTSAAVIKQGAADILITSNMTVGSESTARKGAAIIYSEFTMGAASKIYRVDSLNINVNSYIEVNSKVESYGNLTILGQSSFNCIPRVIKMGSANISSVAELIINGARVIVDQIAIILNSSILAQGTIKKSNTDKDILLKGSFDLNVNQKGLFVVTDNLTGDFIVSFDLNGKVEDINLNGTFEKTIEGGKMQWHT